MDIKTIAIIGGTVVGVALVATGITVGVKKHNKNKAESEAPVEEAGEEVVIGEDIKEEEKPEVKVEVVQPTFTQVPDNTINPAFTENKIPVEN